MERPGPATEDPFGEASSLVERAELDVGAASLAADAGDHDIAYELMLDAVAGWRHAVDLLLMAVPERSARHDAALAAAAAKAAPRVPTRPAADGVVIDLRGPAPVATPPSREPAPVPVAPAPIPVAPAADVDLIGELVTSEHEARRARTDRARGRRRIPKGGPTPHGGTVDSSERIASLLPDGASTEDYEAWVERLREQRAELKQAAGGVDLADVHRSQLPPRPPRRARDVAPPAW